jgi:hypothetical protein
LLVEPLWLLAWSLGLELLLGGVIEALLGGVLEALPGGVLEALPGGVLVLLELLPGVDDEPMLLELDELPLLSESDLAIEPGDEGEACDVR